MPSQKDDAELVTPPPVNHSQSSTPASSLPTVSAAALDGRSFDVPSQQQPRIIQSLHGLSSPASKQATPQLLTMRRRRIIKHYTWTSDQPRLYFKQAPTTTAVPSLIKWANRPSWNPWRLSSCRRVNVCQKVMPLRLLEWPLCGDKALCLLIVAARLLTG